MSRLDSFIRRLEAQRLLLNTTPDLVAGRDGLILELGLGNGRTWDHLREIHGERRIVVFERRPSLPPHRLPAASDLVVGDLGETLEPFAASAGAPILLVHSDLGCGDPVVDAALGTWLGPVLARIVAPGGHVISDQPLATPGLDPLELPEGIGQGRYHLYRRAAAV